MESPSPRVGALVFVPVVVSWLVTATRVVGECRGLGAPWVSSAPGGGNAVLGVVWLVPLFGAWFGWRLGRTTRPWRALALHLLASALYVGGFQVAGRVDGSTAIGLTMQILTMGAVSVVVALLAWLAWPRMFVVSMVYAFAVRIPIAALTFAAVFGVWGTHLEKFGPNDYAGFGPWPQATLLAFTQVVFWTSFTAAAGGLFGSLAALATGHRRPASG